MPGENEMTLEEMERAYTPPAEPEKATDPAPAAPDPVAVSGVEAYKEALRISEEARKQAEARLRDTSTPVQQADDGIDTLTDEDIARLIEEKGQVAALRAIQAQTIRAANKHFSTRMAGMADAGIQLAEAEARRKYPLEFEVFKDDIQAQIKAAPDKGALANGVVWDNLISFIRGKPGNIEKYIAKVNEKASADAQAAALAAQRETAGVHLPNGSVRVREIEAPAATHGLDAIEIEIANTLGMDLQEYAREIGRIK